MKIVQFMASSQWGGAEKILIDLSNTLCHDHDVHVILLRNTDYQTAFNPAVTRHTLQANPTRYNPLLSIEIYRLIKKIKPDIIHTHAIKASELVASLNQWLKTPQVATKHNVRKGKIFTRLSHVTAVSQAVRNTISTLTGGQVYLVPNGIKPLSLPPQKQKKINQCFSLLAVGRLDPIKGFDLLLRQVKGLPFPFHLHIVGEGKARSELQHQIERLCLEKQVTLKGFCPPKQVAQYMQNSHLMVISSHSEGFGNTVIEGLAYAPLLLSTPVGIAPEVLPPLLLCSQQQLHERIKTIHGHYTSFYTLFQQTKQRYLDNFRLDQVANCYVKIYKTICQAQLLNTQVDNNGPNKQ